MSSGLRRALGYLAPDWRRVALAATLQWATVTAAVALMATSAWLIARAAQRPSIAALGVAVVGVRAFGISRGVLRYLERLVSHDLTLRLLARLRGSFYRALEPLAPARLAAYRTGDLLGRLVSDVDTLEHLYVRVVGPSLAAALTIAAVTVLLAGWSGAVAAMAVGGLVAGAAGASLAAHGLACRAGARAVALRAEMHASVVDGLAGLADLVAFGRARAHLEHVAGLGGILAGAQARAAAASALGGTLVTCAADLTCVAAVTVAIPLVRADSLDGLHLAVVALAVLAAFEAVAALPAAYQALDATRAAAARLFDVTDASAAVADPARAELPPPGTRLDVRGLTFAYEPDAPPVLRHVTLSLRPGRLVAVVGPSGAGKSTLVQVLLRFAPVPSSTLFLDDVDATRLRSDDVRARIAWAGQRVDLFTGTVADNLRIARPDAAPAALARAAQLARFDVVVRGLPDGYDTWIGEQGLQLSGGERQRLAVARALSKDAPIVVLDEPTAHLDPATEREVLEGVRSVSRDRAVLVVTHRLVALDLADEILVLRDGGIVERGSFAGLAGADGWFARMLALQREIFGGAARADGGPDADG